MTSGPAWEAVLNATPNAIVLCDEDARVVFANAAAKLLFDRIESSLLGARPEDIVAPDDVPVFTALFEEAMEQGSPGPNEKLIELGIRRANGSISPVEVRFGFIEG